MLPPPIKAASVFLNRSILKFARPRSSNVMLGSSELLSLPKRCTRTRLVLRRDFAREYFTLDKNTPPSIFSNPVDRRKPPPGKATSGKRTTVTDKICLIEKHLANEDSGLALEKFRLILCVLPEGPIIDPSVVKALHDMLMFSYSGDEEKRPIILEEMAERGFFFENSLPNEASKHLFQETVEFSLSKRLFYGFQAFGQPFRNLVDGILSHFDRISGKRTLKAILDQTNPGKRSLAYNNLIVSFAIGKHQPDNAIFLSSLLERMFKLKLIPTSESLSTIVRAYIARCSPDTISNSDNFKTIFEIVRLSKRLAIQLSPYTHRLILECSISLAEVNPEFSSGVIKAAYELRNHRSLLSADLASSALWAISDTSTLNTEHPRKAWCDKTIFGLWVGLKHSALPKEKCAIALLTCASRCDIQPSHLARLLKTFIYLLKPVQSAASSESLAQLIGLCGLLSKEIVIHDFLAEATSRGIPFTKKAFNLTLSNLIESGNSRLAITYFELLTSIGGFKGVSAVVLDTTSIAIVFEASCVVKRPAMIHSFFRSVFAPKTPIVLNEFAYLSFLRGLSRLVQDGSDEALLSSQWVASSLETVLVHLELTGYSGPKDRIVEEVISIHAHFVCQSKGPAAFEACETMLKTFNKLVRPSQLVPQISLYNEMVNAMAQAVALAPGSSLMISDVRSLYKYMLSTNVQPNLAFFVSALGFLGNARDTKSLHFLFRFIVARFKSHRYSDSTPRIAIFNVYLKHALVPEQRIMQFLHTIHCTGAVPTHETLYNMLYKHHELNSPLTVLQNILLLFSDLLNYAREGTTKLEVSIPTVELVAKAFLRAGGISEMSRAVDFVINMMSKPETILPNSFYQFIIDTALLNPDHTAIEVAVDWLERIALRPRSESSSHIVYESARKLKSVDPPLLISLPVEKARFVKSLMLEAERENITFPQEHQAFIP
ncbi:hypothetical protein DSO57_1000081 [Entomophthora muscae]|uniref:Uncharacterized protein n=1 Tax=Entomophthora muscae TaxID=34485 RepID=A0ACC2SMC7_9FUNG|nr:hypothetical protein DSO57_1000081 [Entomophthora muscae]